MSYASGFMMGTALVQGLGSMLMGGSTAGAGAAAGMMGAGKMMGGASRMMGGRGGSMGGKGRASKGFDLPEFNLGKIFKPAEPFKLVSDLPGRRRYRAAVISPELAKLLEEKLAKFDYIKSIQVNAESGSILLTFAPEDVKKIDELAKWMEEKLFKGQSVIATAKEGVPGGKMPEAQAGSITRSIRGTVRAISNWIKDHTGGMFDMSSLASLLFLLRGFRKMLLTGQYPSGSQMLWWAVTLMRGWRTV